MEQPLRLVAFTDPETSIDYRFVTNAHHLKAGEIAEIYKERWKIELFFKWIKPGFTGCGTRLAAKPCLVGVGGWDHFWRVPT